MWERHEIETFLILAEELHFGRTGARLHLTTGQVSKTIKKLEGRIGAALFERTSRQVRLTSLGRQLADELRPAVAEMEATIRRAVEAGKGVTGELQIHFLGPGTEQLVLKAVTLFADRHPDCAVRLQAGEMGTSATRLREGEIDVLVASFPFPGARNGPVLLSEPRVLAIAADHPLARRESVSLEVLAEVPLVQLPDEISAEFRRDRTPSHTPSGRPTLRGPVCSGLSNILTTVAMGRGVYPVGEHFGQYHARPDIAYVPLSDAPPVQWGPVWLPANETARVRAFIGCAVEANRQRGRA
ncbi:LysR family transcriptional regulator [Streptomyces sp. NPDC041068]|uniref:LysR family transcriptional regulator n=1 Tax=Streptomyces sp. NPDC041068 TaxID=3155130 RepID=UPI0033D857DC